MLELPRPSQTALSTNPAQPTQPEEADLNKE
jgi:hypothetical protein